MGNLLRFALGVAIGGALVRALMKRSPEHASNAVVDEPIADTNMVHGGDPEAEQRGPQPQDWRGAQNVLE